MSETYFRKKIEELLSLADVKIGGTRPWDIHVHNNGLYARVLSEGSLGLGESFMEGWWDCPRVDGFFFRLLRAHLDTRVRGITWIFDTLRAKVFNLQKASRAFQIGRRHYDINPRLYECMLDKRMLYSCGYWRNASGLDEAQEAKLDLCCRKLDLKPGMRLLDIGCGWGGTARFAAERYGVEVVGITVSRAQAERGKKMCRGLPVDIRLQDYRDLDETFDRVLSIGMFEHVGCKNYATFMKTVRNCLKPDGLFLLHTIGSNHSSVCTDPWIERYIFPNSMLPSARQICAAADGLFVLEDWHSFGNDYDRTLLQWHRNFDGHWHLLKDFFPESFYRMWIYYLLSCAGSFRARNIQLWQIVLSPEGLEGGFQPPRYRPR